MLNKCLGISSFLAFKKLQNLSDPVSNCNRLSFPFILSLKEIIYLRSGLFEIKIIVSRSLQISVCLSEFHQIQHDTERTRSELNVGDL